MLNIDMTEWSIARRISTVALGLMMALVLITAMGLFSTFRMAAIIEPYSKATDEAVMAEMIIEDVLEAQLAAMQFQSVPTPEVMAEFDANLDEVRAVANDLNGLMADQPNLRKILSDLLSTVATYEENFDAIRSFREQRDDLVRSIIDMGPEIRDSLNGALTATYFDENSRVRTPLEMAIREFDLSRILTERYLLTNSTDDFNASAEHIEKAVRAVDTAASNETAELEKETLLSIRDAISAYSASKRTLFDVIKGRNAVRADMLATVDVMDGFTQAIVDRTEVHREELKSSGDRIELIVSVLLVAVSLTALVAGWFLAHFVGRATRETVEASISDMRSLADGNLGIEIKGTEIENEFGDIARSLVVFRDNAQERIDLEERQRLAAEEAQRQKALEDKRTAEAEAALAQREEEKRRAMLTELSQSIGVVVEAGAKGDFSRRIDVHFDAPELTKMASAINDLVSSVETGVGETSRVVSLLASGDLSVRMEGDFHGAFETLRDNVNRTFETLGSMAAQLSGQCREVGTSAEAMLEQANELSRRAEQQAASLEETSAAIEEIARAASSNAKASAGAAEIANTASSQVENAGDVVSSAVAAMDGIKTSSSRISEIVSVIDGIAFQTNLLALNASVEAARAGSAGKGFAVVASEVRGLAQRSSEASKSIKELIDEGADEVEKGVALVEKAGQSLDEIMEGVGKMAESMKTLTSTAQEQATSIGEVSSAITQMDAITQKNAALAEKGRDNSAEMGQKSTTMSDLVSWFQLGEHDASPTKVAAE